MPPSYWEYAECKYPIRNNKQKKCSTNRHSTTRIITTTAEDVLILNSFANNHLKRVFSEH